MISFFFFCLPAKVGITNQSNPFFDFQPNSIFWRFLRFVIEIGSSWSTLELTSRSFKSKSEPICVLLIVNVSSSDARCIANQFLEATAATCCEKNQVSSEIGVSLHDKKMPRRSCKEGKK